MNLKNIELPSNKKFGYFFCFIFLIIFVYLNFIKMFIAALVCGLISFVFLLLAKFKPYILYPLNKLWMKFGLLLGMVISPIIMGIIFFGIFSPIGIIMRLFKRDELSMIGNNKLSHWKIRKVSQIKSDLFKQQF
tara:strand:+ start:177 stop:578 length:402 start_codon:yes stop_codon:yes gene_type:complete